jgi:crotonobetainyl-CoA:carnitine CoA-transferase CaiB-like acyl-CoA transferase
LFKGYDKTDLMAKLEATGMPFAPIAKPHELFDDPHLNAGGGLSEVTLTDGDGAGRKIKLPNMPLSIGGDRLGVRRDLPREGQHTREVLAELGHDDAAVSKMLEDGIAAGE